MKDEFHKKVNDIRKIYQKMKKNGVLLNNQNNLAWLLPGRTYINIASVSGIVDVLVNDDAVYLITNNIEAKRLMEEEFFKSDLIVSEYEWYDHEGRSKIIYDLTGDNYVTEAEVEAELMDMRLILTQTQQFNYIELGKEAAKAMEASCFKVQKGMSEKMIASLMAQECIKRGIEPIILLVAGDQRIMKYRHPLPTSHVIDREVMLVLGARRYGQCVGLTRFVSFSEPSKQMKELRDSVYRLDALLFENTRPGTCIQEIFKKLVESYVEEGYPEEWKHHHQGGVIGYNPREIKADFHAKLEVQVGQAYAWNPSITGFKAEDTFIVGDSENIVITQTEQLPYYSLPYKQRKVVYPDILIR